MHAVEDALLLGLFEQQLIKIVPGMDWLISPMSGILMVLLFVALGVGLHVLRKRTAPAA